MAHNHYMIQVLGTTYRIEAGHAQHHVFRLSDDRCIGVFEHLPTLRILQSEIAPEQLLQVAKAALRAARLPWVYADVSRRPTAHPRDDGGRKSATQALASLLFVLWPSA